MFLRWIPQASLAAVIMCAVVHMIDVHLAVTLWRAKRKDLVILSTTFIVCIVGGVEVIFVYFAWNESIYCILFVIFTI